MATPHLFQGLNTVSAHVRDIQKARTFYGKTLGLRELNYNEQVKAAYFEIPGSPTPLAVHQFDAGCSQRGGRPPGTVSGIVFTVNDANRAAEELKKKGVTITDPPAPMPWGATMATFSDPDGNEFVISTK